MRRLFGAALLLFTAIIVANAWVIDDAYITFRTIDNFLNGYGLRWNVDERVQTFTHPLWLLLISSVSFVTREFFYTSLAVSLALSVAAVVILSRTAMRDAPWKGPFLILALLTSKAVIDYTSSGLETPLAYIIAAVFVVSQLAERPDEAKLRDATLCGSLSFLTRPDSVVLYLPAIGFYLWRTRNLRIACLASLPAVAWVMFSLIYFGFPLPNTAYAKELGTGFPSSWIVRRGIDYFVNSLTWDAASYGMLVLALVVGAAHRSARLVLTGVVGYVALAVLRLGATTHMSGRHFAIPLFIAIATAVHLLKERRVAMAISVALGGYLIWNPVSPIKFGTSWYVPYGQHWSYLDTKYFALKEGTALLDWRPARHLPDHTWLHYGTEMRLSSKRVFVGAGDPNWDRAPGVLPGSAVGFAGFAAGPDKFIIDVVALGDPLLARLPAKRPDKYEDWKSGHFYRDVPKGYVESVINRGNMIADPDLHEFYNLIRTITRGPIWSTRRLLAIAQVNVGAYDHLLHDASAGP